MEQSFSGVQFMSQVKLATLGVDVAKLKLDVALQTTGKTCVKQFENSPAGFRALQEWLASFSLSSVHACLEATGTYGDAAALFLHEHGHVVSLVNPFRIKGYAASKLQRNKTDKADARLIAEFCATQNPPPWTPPALEIRQLQALTRRIETLTEMLQMEKNRRESAPAETHDSLDRIITALAEEIAKLQHEINQHLDQHPQLKAKRDLLLSIPGVGEKTAQLLLSEVDFARYDDARQVAAAAGVTPRKQESGSSLKRTSLSKLGNGRIRKALYFPAIVATRRNQIIKEFAARLKKNGKTPMQIVCAAMRKLLHQAFGVLKHNCPFNPDLVFVG
jgi:transposase